MTADTMYQILLYAVAKNKQDGYVSPQDFYVIINSAQQSYTDYLLGEYQQYQLRRPISAVEIGQNERVRQSLAPLIYGTVLSITSTPGSNPYSGTSNFPSDYLYPDAMWSQYGLYNIKFVQQDRLASFNKSVIDPVATNPIYLINHEGFQFIPPNPNGDYHARMSYVRTPPSIVWGYVLDSNGRHVYDASISQQPVWSDTDCLQIIVRALALVGVNLQFPMVSQYANEVKMRGQ